jgi:hypothetical protein
MGRMDAGRLAGRLEEGEGERKGGDQERGALRRLGHGLRKEEGRGSLKARETTRFGAECIASAARRSRQRACGPGGGSVRRLHE